MSRPIVIGMDVGSTTVKAVVVDPATKEIVWHDYQRHHTKQPETVHDFLVRIGQAFDDVAPGDVRLFLTGSGAGPLEGPTGGRFVQEVNAVTLAVETLHPEVQSVVELGGQDAKIIIFKENPTTGDKTASCSMNDKCASGTGATIDKCMIKVGVPQSETAKLHFDDSKLHHVAAKCGVFAETDIVNLVKTGIPSNEILCSLADAIVMQNLSVLTRGNTLKDKVLLLGGPNTYLPFLQECWRKRIPEVWRERGYAFDESRPIEELIAVPDNAELYAAYGAVMYGLHEPADAGRYAGLDGLKRYITEGRKARLGESAGPPLVADSSERERFVDAYKVPRFDEPAVEGTVRAVIGLDGGSTSSKAVLLDERGEILMKAYTLSKGNPIQDTKDLLADMRQRMAAKGVTLEVLGFGATGYAADVLEECLRADVNIVETVAHMMSATHYFGDVDVICDIGGQDIKVLFMENGDIKSFKLSNQCSAGNGMLLQAMADQFGLPVTEYADTAFEAELAPRFSYGCAVFLDTDRVNFQKEGFSKEELLAGLAQVLPKNVWQYVVGVPRLAALGRRFVLQGGTQYNLAAVKAQVDYIKERVPGAEVFVHPHSGEAGAIGAAMETLRVVTRRGESTFVGLDAAIDLEYTTKNDEETVCHFCANECSRTFIDALRPDGSTSRYISGFSCEKGTVESEDAMIALVRERKKIMREFPNLVTYEALKAFQRQKGLTPMPEAGSPVEETSVKRSFWGQLQYETTTRGFVRGDTDEAVKKKRRTYRLAMPRVLNMYSTAPFWVAYFQSCGVDPRNIVWSDESSEEMFAEGGKYGSVDPCYPSKVAQAHFHNLFFHHHVERPIDSIFFPILTHVPQFLEHTVATTTCPIVAGTPEVMKAAFTKEQDFFATRGIRFYDPSLSFDEPVRMKSVLFETFKDELGLTEDESNFAVEQGFAALERHDQDLQAKGRAILEQVEHENRVAILVVGRPYHLDPGLHHGIPDEFQVLGYPILSIRSIPKDPEFLTPYFREDLDAGRIQSPLDINDVWPENYSVNSAMKVWAVKFAARHPNVVLLDLSSFKCGHDAPTFGIIDRIVEKSAVPYSALHDLDANKPGGSIKIRVKTYAHSLKLHEERLEDLAFKRLELERRVTEKRLELLKMKQTQLAERRRRDPEIEAQIQELTERLASYVREADPEQDARAAAAKGLVQLGKKANDGRVTRVGA